MSDTIKKSNELHETDLEAASGGILSSDIADNHDPAVCSTYTDVQAKCQGYRSKNTSGPACEHYRVEHIMGENWQTHIRRSYCLKGYYDYSGPVVPEGFF